MAERLGGKPKLPEPCANLAGHDETIRCILVHHFPGSEKADVLGAFDSVDWIVSTEPPRQFDGGWRGEIELVPELPVGAHGRHARWFGQSALAFSDFFEAVRTSAKQPVRYRYRNILFPFFRSVGRTTPSAFARGWTISYNVSGSLFRSEQDVVDTLFHEVFHLNDADHEGWSDRKLAGYFDDIVGRCGQRTACLTPFAPTSTRVKDGTYYAFYPGNGVREYAAELSLRYFKEQRAALGQGPAMTGGGNGAPGRFKCGPEPNAEAWRALVDEFFGGFDAVPACSPP